VRDGRIGSLLGQRFRIEERVAAGGFGVLYRAIDTQRDEPVALKVLSLEDESERRRFEREGDFLAKISYPNVVGFVRDGRAQDGSPWLAMQWIDGVDLRATRAAHGREQHRDD
jgi:serine/threonine protein kinase